MDENQNVSGAAVDNTQAVNTEQATTDNSAPNHVVDKNATTGATSANETATPVIPQAPVAGNSGSHTGLIIGLVVGGVCLIGLVLGCIFILPMIFGVDWKETREAADAFVDANNAVSRDCSDATIYVDSTTKKTETYNGYVSKCQEAIDKFIDQSKKMSSVSGVKRNDEIKAKHDKFAKSLDEVGPILSGLPSLLSAEHEVLVNLEDLDDDDILALSESKISEIVKPLREVEAEAVKSYATNMADQIEEYYKIYVKYEQAREAWYDVSYSDPNYNAIRSAYESAREAYYDAELDTDFDDVTDKIDALSDQAEALYNEIYDQYRKNN